jgi:hypothetical protein
MPDDRRTLTRFLAVFREAGAMLRRHLMSGSSRRIGRSLRRTEVLARRYIVHLLFLREVRFGGARVAEGFGQKLATDAY